MINQIKQHFVSELISRATPGEIWGVVSSVKIIANVEIESQLLVVHADDMPLVSKLLTDAGLRAKRLLVDAGCFENVNCNLQTACEVTHQIDDMSVTVRAPNAEEIFKILASLSK
jgi:hypothetical protein